MAKTLITDSTEGTTTPFLRGILTRSLTDAGMSFETAYQLATDMRQAISHKPNLTTQELRQLVLRELHKQKAFKVLESYEHQAPSSQVMVRNRSDQSGPFSRAEHHRSLTSTGLSSDEATFTTRMVYQMLAESPQTEVTSNQIGRLTYAELKRQYGKEAANRYLVWIDYKRSRRPLIMLIGGTTGCGKSTIATEVAHRLGIIRTQSTDMLREVMRMLIPERLLPALHTSSFNAWRRMPAYKETEEITEEMMIGGYLHQSEMVAVPCEAVVQRALSERVSLIVEGVHVHPVLIERFPRSANAVIVPVMLAVLKQDRLKHQLKGRGVTSPDRSIQSQYLSNFDSIWSLQSYLLSESDNRSIQILENDDIEKTTDRVMRAIIEVLQSDFTAKADDVFGVKR
jgi:2-phosphoglycerate kinase